MRIVGVNTQCKQTVLISVFVGWVQYGVVRQFTNLCKSVVKVARLTFKGSATSCRKQSVSAEKVFVTMVADMIHGVARGVQYVPSALRVGCLYHFRIFMDWNIWCVHAKIGRSYDLDMGKMFFEYLDAASVVVMVVGD